MNLQLLFSSGAIEADKDVIIFDIHSNRLMKGEWLDVKELADCLDIWSRGILKLDSFYEDNLNFLKITLDVALYTVPKSYIKNYESITGIKL